MDRHDINHTILRSRVSHRHPTAGDPLLGTGRCAAAQGRHRHEHRAPACPGCPGPQNEPTELQVKIDLIRRFRGQFDLGQDFTYGIFDREETQALGGTGLHTRPGPDAREIGYWVRADRINQGIATETAGALTRVAFEIDKLDRVEIHCDADNVRSASVPRKLGFTHEATLRRRRVGGKVRDTLVWTLLADEYPGSSAAQVLIEAFDAIGRRIL